MEKKIDTKHITRLMITTAVDHGIKEMADDPKRALRKLVDMGSQFSAGRFQPAIFNAITTILKNEDSHYYKLIQDFLFNTDFNSVKTFGINMGYESWTYNARVLREKSEELGHNIPWVLGISYNPFDSSTDSMNASNISKLIEEAKAYGINTFGIHQESSFTSDTEIFDIFLKNEYSAFLYVLADAQITALQASLLKKAANVMLLINADAPYAKETCQMLYESGVLFSIYKFYEENDIPNMSSPEYYAPLTDFNNSMIFMIRSQGCSVSAGEIIKNLRFNDNVPAIVWDFSYDAQLINELLCGSSNILHFDSKGNVISPENSNYNILTEGENLQHIITSTMPKVVDNVLENA